MTDDHTDDALNASTAELERPAAKAFKQRIPPRPDVRAHPTTDSARWSV